MSSFPFAKGHAAIDAGVERIVLASAHIFAGKNRRAALPHQDGAALDQLSVANFGAEILWLGISPQPSGTTRFFMCHIDTR